MEKYPDCETYRALYKRFYDKRKPEELIALAGSLKGKAVLDLCAGDGRLSLEAIKCGASLIWLFEKEKQMIPKETLQNKAIYIQQDLVAWLLNEWWKSLSCDNEIEFDVAFCQQGVNYWLDKATAMHLSKALKRNSLFIFNTFNKKPPEKPLVKEYELDGKKFAEISWLVNDVVHHVQIREGMPPHTTTFAWLSTDYLEKILSPYFHLAIHFQNNTSIYRCLRK